MCVSKIKEIHAWVTEFCSGNEMQTSGRGTYFYPPPNEVGAGDKNRSNVTNPQKAHLHPPSPKEMCVAI